MIYLTTSEQLKAANSSVAKGLDIESLESFVDEAEFEVMNILGEATISQILPNAIPATLLRKVIANIALANYASSGAIIIDNSGIHVVKASNKAPASDKKLLNFKADTFERTWKSLEQLISYLEANIATYTAWKSSTFRNTYLSTLFTNSGEFASFGGMAISASLFKIIKPLIARVEENVLYPNFGAELINELRSQRLNNTLTIAMKKLERKLMRTIAPLAIAEAIPMELIKISEAGVYEASIVALGSTSDNIQAHSAVERNKLNFVLGKLISEGEAILQQTKDWIKLNASEYPLYVVRNSISREELHTDNTYLL